MGDIVFYLFDSFNRQCSDKDSIAESELITRYRIQTDKKKNVFATVIWKVIESERALCLCGTCYAKAEKGQMTKIQVQQTVRCPFSLTPEYLPVHLVRSMILEIYAKISDCSFDDYLI